MQVVIFCGGGSLRFQNERFPYNKVMAPIGKYPLLVYIMNVYSVAGFTDFILCVRDNDEFIHDFFQKQTLFKSVQVIKTGNDTPTGGRLAQVKDLITTRHFWATYGDGICDLDLKSLLKFHEEHGKLGTLTAVNPQSQYGILDVNDNNEVKSFLEKPIMKEWINGGFFIFNSSVLETIPENEMLETGLLHQLSAENQLMAFKHYGFWKSMDTVKDFEELNKLAYSGKLPIQI